MGILGEQSFVETAPLLPQVWSKSLTCYGHSGIVLGCRQNRH